MIKFFLMVIVVMAAIGKSGNTNMMALGDCYDCNFNLRGDHHERSDYDDGTDCGDNNGG